jgi:hypothetical protein
LNILSVGINEKEVRSIISENKYYAFPGNLNWNKGNRTIICNTLIAPHKNYNDPELYEII